MRAFVFILTFILTLPLVSYQQKVGKVKDLNNEKYLNFVAAVQHSSTFSYFTVIKVKNLNYALGVVSVFGHIASVHNNKMSLNIVGLTPNGQAKAIFIFGLCLVIVLFYGLTNRFRGAAIPKEYQVLIGK